jgi:hypothetical protein
VVVVVVALYCGDVLVADASMMIQNLLFLLVFPGRFLLMHIFRYHNTTFGSWHTAFGMEPLSEAM